MTTTKTTLTHTDLTSFSGDVERYQHPLNRRVIYTPGVQFLAERGQAYWLVDAIASYFGSDEMQTAIEEDSRLAWLQFWRLEVQEDQKATLTARADSDVTPFVIQEFQYTDFPLSKVDVWAGNDGTYWTLYLPSEH